jgi:hypothetical protein
MANLPKYGWKEWLFKQMPIHFWNDLSNRKRYILHSASADGDLLAISRRG